MMFMSMFLRRLSASVSLVLAVAGCCWNLLLWVGRGRGRGEDGEKLRLLLMLLLLLLLLGEPRTKLEKVLGLPPGRLLLPKAVKLT